MKAKRARRAKRAKRIVQRIEGLAERLRLTIASYGTVTATASAINRSEGALRKWIRGASEPNASDLRAICELTGTRIDWLIFGENSTPQSPPEIGETGGTEK
jgi:transcriptional regulator with XRE-family HTH domain